MEKAQRLISLDILRGITIAGMIIVNRDSRLIPSL